MLSKAEPQIQRLYTTLSLKRIPKSKGKVRATGITIHRVADMEQ